MPQKILLPIVTKIIAIGAICVSFCYLLLLLYLSYSFEWLAIYRNFDLFEIRCIVIIFGYGAASFGLLMGRRIWWYVEAAIFVLMICLDLASEYAPSFFANLFNQIVYIPPQGEYFISAMITLLFFAIFLADRKNYFAAVEEAKKGEIKS